MLNGQYLNFRGVGLHEASQEEGFAIDDNVRTKIATEAKALGATVLRTHYPMHPYMHELADRLGLLIWSEVPVYAVKTQYLKRPLVRELAAKELAKNIEANQNHPSVMLWSLGNELSARPGPVQSAYIKAAARQAKALDPTRPVGIAVAGYPSVGCQAQAYAPLDVIGVNEYFGWYPGPSGQIFDRTRLPGYLDSLHACYPAKAVVISEFGAEANRDGPVEEKGTWAFQQDFVNYHLGVYATKPWLSGAIYWALNEFWVRPGWEGGNPRPQSPLFQKGLLMYGDVGAQARLGGRATAGTRRRSSSRRWAPRLVCARGVRRGCDGWRTVRRSRRVRRRSPCERRRVSDGSASGSGMPPDGDVCGDGLIRSLPPPPPPSSSSGGGKPSAVSARRNMTKRMAPSASAIRCSAPKITISSSSGDITPRVPGLAERRRHFASMASRPWPPTPPHSP